VASQQLYPFSNPANYTPDAGAEISGGKGILTDRRPANATFYNSFNTSKDADWSTGSGTGTLQGSATVSGGLLNLDGAGNNYLDMVGPSNMGIRRGCVRVLMIPRYTGTPSAEGALISRKKTASANNTIMLRHSTGGGWILMSKDKNGSGAATSIGAWSPTANQTYEIELNWNVDSATGSRWWMYIDGALFYSANTYRDFDSDFDLMQCGAHGTIWNNPNWDADAWLVFDQEQHAGASYTPDWTGIYETIYSTSDPKIVFNVTVSMMKALDQFAETSTKPGSDELKYTVTIDGTEKYWSGAAWVNSNGTYAQANTAAVIEANKASLPLAGTPSGSVVQLTMFLHSADGSTTPEADLVTVDYTPGTATGLIMNMDPYYW
jgi:hypothetical protein